MGCNFRGAGQFRAISGASVSLRLWDFRSFHAVLSHVIGGHTGGLFQPSKGSANRIFLASMLSSIHAICPKGGRDAWIGWLRQEMTYWFSAELLHWKRTGTIWYRAACACIIDRGRQFSLNPASESSECFNRRRRERIDTIIKIWRESVWLGKKHDIRCRQRRLAPEWWSNVSSTRYKLKWYDELLLDKGKDAIFQCSRQEEIISLPDALSL